MADIDPSEKKQFEEQVWDDIAELAHTIGREATKPESAKKIQAETARVQKEVAALWGIASPATKDQLKYFVEQFDRKLQNQGGQESISHLLPLELPMRTNNHNLLDSFHKVFYFVINERRHRRS